MATNVEDAMLHANLGPQKIDALKSLADIKKRIQENIDEVKTEIKNTPEDKVFLTGQLDTLSGLMNQLELTESKLLKATVDTWPVVVEEAVEEAVTVTIASDMLTAHRLLRTPVAPE